MTSVALTKVLFARWWGGDRKFTSMAPDLDQMLTAHDAALLIGDPALKIDRTRYLTHDLAEEWVKLTGKPFVFAFWAVRREALTGASNALDLATTFQQSRDHGLSPANVNQIVHEWAPRLGLSEEVERQYLTQHIHYFLDAQCLEGLQLFYKYAHECGALPVAPRLDFIDAGRAVAV